MAEMMLGKQPQYLHLGSRVPLSVASIDQRFILPLSLLWNPLMVSTKCSKFELQRLHLHTLWYMLPEG